MIKNYIIQLLLLLKQSELLLIFKKLIYNQTMTFISVMMQEQLKTQILLTSTKKSQTTGSLKLLCTKGTLI